MKYRKLLIALRLWGRACIARRQVKRLTHRAAILAKATAQEKLNLTSHYERQLAIERARNESIHQFWTDRWMQREKLAASGISTQLLEEKAAAKLPPQFQEDVEESLTNDQRLELEERRSQFFSEGYAMEKSHQEIVRRWEDIKESVISDVRMAIM